MTAARFTTVPLRCPACGQQTHKTLESVVQDGGFICKCGARNDLERAAVVVEPQLAWWRDRIIAELGVEPTLAGSGATWFVDDGPGVGTGDRAGSSLARLERLGATIVHTSTVDAVRATGPGA